MEHQACPKSHLALVQGAEEQSQVLLTPLKQINAQIICCSEEVAVIPFAEILHLNQSHSQHRKRAEAHLSPLLQ